MKMLEILTRESENTQHVYVYEEDGCWYAYERSAELVQHLLNGLVKIKQFINSTYEVMLNRVEVDLTKLLEICPITLCSDSEIVLECADL